MGLGAWGTLCHQSQTGRAGPTPRLLGPEWPPRQTGPPGGAEAEAQAGSGTEAGLWRGRVDPWPLTPVPASCLRPGGPPHTVNAFGSLHVSMLAWPGAAWGSQGLGATFPQGVLLLPRRVWPGGTPAGGAGLSG